MKKYMNKLSLSDGLSQRLAYKKYSAHNHKWRAGSWQIRQNHIFILPTRHGFYMGFLVLAGFAMGYKVQNNFILLAVIFLFLTLLLSLIASTRNLQGLRIKARIEPYYFAGRRQYIHLNFTKSRAAFGVALMCNGYATPLDLSQAACRICVPVGDFGRGIYPIGAFKLVTRFPFGIATSWVWLAPAEQIIVAPAPLELPLNRYRRGRPAASVHHQHWQNINKSIGENDDAGDLRNYQPDDPPKRIDWKHFAATRTLLVREQNEPAQGALILTPPAAADWETALSYLAGGLCVAEKQNLPAYMTLNGATYRIYDKAERQQAYHALARA